MVLTLTQESLREFTWFTRWTQNSARRRSSRLRVLSFVRLYTVGCRAFPVAAPRIWNALPEETTSAQSLTSFRQHLKTWLFRESYPDLIFWSVLHWLS